MLDSVRKIAHDSVKMGQSFLGAKNAFQSAYRGATGTGSNPQLSVRSK